MTTRDLKRFPYFDVVAYHDNCLDGLCAAAVAAQHTPDAEFIPVQYQQPLPAAITNGGERILFVDFCPEEEKIGDLLNRWEDLFIIDHHKSRAWVEALYPNNCYFHPYKSGAMLAWEWFKGGEPVPTLIQYVQDRDLWRWKLPESREVSAALWQQPKTVTNWRNLLRDVDEPGSFNSLPLLKAHGRLLLKQQTAQVRDLAKQAFPVRFGAENFLAVNAPVLPSEVCHQLLDQRPAYKIACAFSFVPDGIRLSFRASEGHSCLELARQLGGGGHEQAAGAKLDWQTFLRVFGGAQ